MTDQSSAAPLSAPAIFSRFRSEIMADEPIAPDTDYHEASKAARSTYATQLGPLLDHFDPSFVPAQQLGDDIQRVGGPATPLADPEFGVVSVKDAVTRRSSSRAFGAGALGFSAFSTLLWSAAGRVDAASTRRTAPSGGGLYPLDVYVCVRDVDDLSPGLYQYDPARHSVRCVDDRSTIGETIARCFIHTDVSERAQALVMFAGVFHRSKSKYGQRSLRFVLLEAGHCAQNLLIGAEALDVAACPLGGYFDRELDHCLDLNGVDESVVYAAAIGTRSTRQRDAR